MRYIDKKNYFSSNQNVCSVLFFYKKNDRIMLFHGVNIVTKNFPWFSDQGHSNLKNKTNLENLKKWGFNTIRLGNFYIKKLC